LKANITENEMSATNSLKESCGKKPKCAVSSNRHDMDSSTMGGKNREAAGGGMVAEENNQLVHANAIMHKEKSSATKMKSRLHHSNIIIRKRKVSECSTLSTQETASKSKRKKERCQAEDEMANKDAKQNERKKRKTSDSHPAVAAGIDVSDLIHDEANMDDGIDVHTMTAREKHADETWNKRFMELVEYEEKNGHCNIPQRNGTLGRWISRQRNLFRSKELKADRYEKLVGVGFEDQIFAIGNERWNILFMELVEYEEKNGHCNLSSKNGTLGGWISTQRNLFRSKKLKADRYEKLVGIDFVFEDQKFAIDNERWNILFMELVKYKEKNGHCNLSSKNGTLGGWISTQRNLFRSKKLKADRYEKLVGIGFVFENAKVATDNEKWNKRFMELAKYKEKNGHCNIPITNVSLGSFISDQRRLFRSKKLKEDRYEKLVDIGFVFENVTALKFKGKLDQKWQEMYQKLLEHKEMKGHCFNVPEPLGSWLRRQRWLYRNGNLREDRAEKLLSVCFHDKKVPRRARGRRCS
jgi:hypothetical protein